MTTSRNETSCTFQTLRFPAGTFQMNFPEKDHHLSVHFVQDFVARAANCPQTLSHAPKYIANYEYKIPTVIKNPLL